MVSAISGKKRRLRSYDLIRSVYKKNEKKTCVCFSVQLVTPLRSMGDMTNDVEIVASCGVGSAPLCISARGPWTVRVLGLN